jgi:hypothetical protein
MVAGFVVTFSTIFMGLKKLSCISKSEADLDISYSLKDTNNVFHTCGLLKPRKSCLKYFLMSNKGIVLSDNVNDSLYACCVCCVCCVVLCVVSVCCVVCVRVCCVVWVMCVVYVVGMCVRIF